MFYIIQVCSVTCEIFRSFKICSISDYKKFVRENYNEYEDYTYYIFNSDSSCVDILEFM